MRKIAVLLVLAIASGLAASADQWFELDATMPRTNAAPIRLKISAPRRSALEDKAFRLVGYAWNGVARQNVSFPENRILERGKQYDTSSDVGDSGSFVDAYLYCDKRKEIVQLLLLADIDGLSAAVADNRVREKAVNAAYRSVWFNRPGLPDVGGGDIRYLYYERSTTSFVRGEIPERRPTGNNQAAGSTARVKPALMQPFTVAPGTWYTFIGIHTEPGTTKRSRVRYTFEMPYPEAIVPTMTKIFPHENAADPAYFNVEEGSLARTGNPVVYRERAGTPYLAFSRLPSGILGVPDEMLTIPLEVTGNTGEIKLERAMTLAWNLLYPGDGIIPEGEQRNAVQTAIPAPAPAATPVAMSPSKMSPGNWYEFSINFRLPERPFEALYFLMPLEEATPGHAVQTVSAAFPDEPLLAAPESAIVQIHPTPRYRPNVYRESPGYLYRAYLERVSPVYGLEGVYVTRREACFFESAFPGPDTDEARDAAALDLARRWVLPGNGIHREGDTLKVVSIALVSRPQVPELREETVTPPPEDNQGIAEGTAPLPPPGQGAAGGTTASPAGSNLASTVKPGAGTSTKPPIPTITLKTQKWSVIVEVVYAGGKKEKRTVSVQATTEKKAGEDALAEVKKQLGKTAFTGMSVVKVSQVK